MVRFIPMIDRDWGIVFDAGSTNLIDEITQPRNISGYRRPDGSFT